MDLRCAIALGLAGGFATTAAPALAATTTPKSPRDRLDAQAPSEAASEDVAPRTISKLDLTGTTRR